VEQATAQGNVFDFPFMRGEFINFDWSDRARFLGTVQAEQDRRYTWGDALLRAQGLPVDESKYEYTDY